MFDRWLLKLLTWELLIVGSLYNHYIARMFDRWLLKLLTWELLIVGSLYNHYIARVVSFMIGK